MNGPWPRVLPTLDDELEATAAIEVDVLRGDTLWRAVHDHVSLTEQVVQDSRDVQSGRAHPARVFARGGHHAVNLHGRLFHDLFTGSFSELLRGLPAAYYEAILATLAILVWHFYSTILNPDVFPVGR